MNLPIPDAEKMLSEMSGKDWKDSIDFYVYLTVLEETQHSLNGYPFSFVYRDETYEEVNGHGNETGVFRTRRVRDILWKDTIWSESDLRVYLRGAQYEPTNT